MELKLCNYKTDFAFGEDFSVGNLIVKATLENGELKVLNANDYLVDYSSYNSLIVGEYLVKVTIKNTQISGSYKVKVNPANKLKVLMIGNSFSDDTIQWGYEVATSIGIPAENVIIADIFIGGCPLKDQWANAQTNFAGYEFRIDKEGDWDTIKTNATMLEAIKYADWDFITLQQASGFSGVSDTYKDLQNLMDYVRANATNPKVKLVWHQTWAYQQNSTHGDFYRYNNNQLTMYNAIISSMQSEVLTKDFATIIPNGTAVQNARTSYLGDNLTRDGFHLNLQFGRYIASLTLVKVLTGRDIADVFWSPNLNKNQINVCKESVNNAVKNPLKITNCV